MNAAPALTRLEAVRLLRHPIFRVGAAWSAASFVVVSRHPPDDPSFWSISPGQASFNLSWTISQSSWRWLLPLAGAARFTAPGASFPPGTRSESGLANFDTSAAGWHLLYLAALAVLLGAVALLRQGPSRRPALVAGGALLVLVAAAALQSS